jgi:CDP-glucose 4,6-dehydratase
VTDLAAGRSALAGRRVLLTGHTGFKGAWLALWLSKLGATVTGFALPPTTSPNAFEAAGVAGVVARSVEGDIRDRAAVTAVVAETRPELVLHLAAQSLVPAAAVAPVETF